jgi:hypothetical protein
MLLAGHVVGNRLGGKVEVGGGLLDSAACLDEWVGHGGDTLLQTSLTNLIIFNLTSLLAVLGLVWVCRVVLDRLSERRRNRHRVVCGVCGHVFRDPARTAVVSCPACSRRVERQEVLDI